MALKYRVGQPIGNEGSISLLSSRLLDQITQENKFVLICCAPIECGTQSLVCWFQWWIVPLGTQLECLGQPLLQIKVTYRFYHVPMFECKKTQSLNFNFFFNIYSNENTNMAY